MADVQHRLGKIHLELEEFEEAQKHLRHSFATRKEVYGVKNMDTMEAHLWFAMSARLAGNIQHAKEILDTAKDSLLGKVQLLYKCLKQIVNRLMCFAIQITYILCCAVIWVCD